MDIDQKKLIRQQLGVNHWRYSKSRGAPRNGCGTLKYYTGVGKTYTAMLIIKEVLASDKSRKIIVVVPTDRLQKDWKENIKLFLDEDVQKNITVYTVQLCLSLRNYLECTLLVIDELHEFYSEERIKVADGTLIKFKHNLGLTATTEEDDKRSEKLLKIYPIIDEITEKEAREEGYISDYVEYNLGVNLSEDETNEYEAITDSINSFMSKFGKHGFPAAQLCLSGNAKWSGFKYCMMWALENGWYEGIDMTDPTARAIDDLWNPHKVMGYARNLMLKTRERQELIFRIAEKYTVGVELIQKFNTLQTICFSQSTVFADKLTALINKTTEQDIAVSYHSRIPSQPLKRDNGEYIKYQSGVKKGEVKMFGTKVLRELAIKRIKDRSARVLVTASALDKGADFPNIKLGIIFSGTQNPTQQGQRGGRVKRINPEDKEGTKLIINVYARNTKEEISLRNRQKKGTNIIHWANSVEDIDFNPNIETGFNLVITSENVNND